MTYAKRLAEAALDAEVPHCLGWDAGAVGHWVESIGFPQYKDCFVSNYITGRKLVFMDACHLPKIGVTDFQDIKELTAAIRRLLKQEEPRYSRKITLPAASQMGLFLERKAKTGARADRLTYTYFLKENAKNFKLWYTDKDK